MAEDKITGKVVKKTLKPTAPGYEVQQETGMSGPAPVKETSKGISPEEFESLKQEGVRAREEAKNVSQPAPEAKPSLGKPMEHLAASIQTRVPHIQVGETTEYQKAGESFHEVKLTLPHEGTTKEARTHLMSVVGASKAELGKSLNAGFRDKPEVATLSPTESRYTFGSLKGSLHVTFQGPAKKETGVEKPDWFEGPASDDFGKAQHIESQMKESMPQLRGSSLSRYVSPDSGITKNLLTLHVESSHMRPEQMRSMIHAGVEHAQRHLHTLYSSGGDKESFLHQEGEVETPTLHMYAFPGANTKVKVNLYPSRDVEEQKMLGVAGFQAHPAPMLAFIGLAGLLGGAFTHGFQSILRRAVPTGERYEGTPYEAGEGLWTHGGYHVATARALHEASSGTYGEQRMLHEKGHIRGGEATQWFMARLANVGKEYEARTGQPAPWSFNRPHSHVEEKVQAASPSGVSIKESLDVGEVKAGRQVTTKTHISEEEYQKAGSLIETINQLYGKIMEVKEGPQGKEVHIQHSLKESDWLGETKPVTKEQTQANARRVAQNVAGSRNESLETNNRYSSSLDRGITRTMQARGYDKPVKEVPAFTDTEFETLKRIKEYNWAGSQYAEGHVGNPTIYHPEGGLGEAEQLHQQHANLVLHTSAKVLGMSTGEFAAHWALTKISGEEKASLMKEASQQGGKVNFSIQIGGQTHSHGFKVSELEHFMSSQGQADAELLGEKAKIAFSGQHSAGGTNAWHHSDTGLIVSTLSQTTERLANPKIEHIQTATGDLIPNAAFGKLEEHGFGRLGTVSHENRESYFGSVERKGKVPYTNGLGLNSPLMSESHVFHGANISVSTGGEKGFEPMVHDEYGTIMRGTKLKLYTAIHHAGGEAIPPHDEHFNYHLGESEGVKIASPALSRTPPQNSITIKPPHSVLGKVTTVESVQAMRDVLSPSNKEGLTVTSAIQNVRAGKSPALTHADVHNVYQTMVGGAHALSFGDMAMRHERMGMIE